MEIEKMGLQQMREAYNDKSKALHNLLEQNKSDEAYAKVRDEALTLQKDCAALDERIGLYATALREEADGKIMPANGVINHDFVEQKFGSISRAAIDARLRERPEFRAFDSWLRNGKERISADDAAKLEFRNQTGRIVNIAEGSGATGGAVVPTIIMPTAIQKLKEYGDVRKVAQHISTSGGEPIQWGTYDVTTQVASILAENTAASPGDIANWGTVGINAYKFATPIIPVSIEILQDAVVDIEAVVLDALLQMQGRGQNAYFTTGTGTGQPMGVVTAAAPGRVGVTGFTTTVGYKDLVELEHSLDPAYRKAPTVRFMMHDQTLKAIKELVDNNGRPLWLPSLGSAFDGNNSLPSTIIGYRYEINQQMAVMAANALSILFGDFNRYLVRDVMNIQIFRFTDSPYVSKGQIGFFCLARADGRFIDVVSQSYANQYESMRYYQNSAT